MLMENNEARKTFQKFERSSVLELGRQAAYTAFGKIQNSETAQYLGMQNNGSHLWNEPA